MTPAAPLPSFLTAQPTAAPARMRLLEASNAPAVPVVPAVPAMVQDTYQPNPYYQAPPAPSRNQQVGQATLSTVTTGLGVAGVFAPPVLPIAGVVGGIQLLDAQIGNPISTSVGATIRFVGDVGSTVGNAVGDAAKGVGRFFGKLF